MEVYFRRSGESPIMIKCTTDMKVSEIIQRYRDKSNDFDINKKFIFNAKLLCSDLTVAEAGIYNNSNIFVAKTKGIKGYSPPEINLIFRSLKGDDQLAPAPIMIKCTTDMKVSEIIQRYRDKSNDFDINKKFIYNDKALCADLTVAEAGLYNNSNIFVVKTDSLENSNEIYFLNNELNRLKIKIENQNFTMNELKEELNISKEIIKTKNKKINELENQLNLIKEESDYNLAEKISTIEFLQNQLKEKECKLLNLKVNNFNSKGEKMVKESQIAVINFSSLDQKVHYATSCLNSSIFAEIEEKLYKIYPEYRETNNIFIANGKTILRFKTIAENGIGNGFPVVLYPPNND